MPVATQAKLLRVLEERKLRRLGARTEQDVDVRVLAATNRDPAEAVADGHLRSDLYYRLNVFPIPVPPLRERREDIPLLVRHFLKSFAEQMGKRIDEIPPVVMDALANHSWPGNIRELQNFVERSAILSSGNVLRCPIASLQSAPEAEPPRRMTLMDAERDHIRKTLEHTRWVVAGPRGAAARLGIKRSTLYFRMQKLGISRSSEKSASHATELA
jgi:formate hydrogenlyase transcriptional activator